MLLQQLSAPLAILGKFNGRTLAQIIAISLRWSNFVHLLQILDMTRLLEHQMCGNAKAKHSLRNSRRLS
jgi:hypothetical protein